MIMRIQTFVAAASFVLVTALWGAETKGAKRPAADVTKVAVEQPVAAVIKNASPAVDQPAAVMKPQALNNPSVKPGLVCWHSSFAEACEASGRTHKPVLLFQLLGKLDHQFC
jgi:hypothetical protein